MSHRGMFCDHWTHAGDEYVYCGLLAGHVGRHEGAHPGGAGVSWTAADRRSGRGKHGAALRADPRAHAAHEARHHA